MVKIYNSTVAAAMLLISRRQSFGEPQESPKFTVSSHVESSSSNPYREEGFENEGQDAGYQAANQL